MFSKTVVYCIGMYHTEQMYHVLIVLEQEHSCGLNRLFIMYLLLLKEGQLHPGQGRLIGPGSLSLEGGTIIKEPCAC